MYRVADKKQRHSNQSVANGIAQQQANASTFRFQDNRPESVAQRRLQQITSTQNGTVQLMSDGNNFSRKLLGAKAEEKTSLKQWKTGEFYAWDRTNERKDHHHIHCFVPNVGNDRVVVTGHVVTAKGEGKDKSKRNLTQHEIVGTKDKKDVWTVDSKPTSERLELPAGSREVPKEKHAEEEWLLRGNMQNAVHYLLNTPDEQLGDVDKSADKIERRLAKKERRKMRKRQKKREAESSEEEIDLGMSIFDL